MALHNRPASLKGLVIPVALEDLNGHEITHCCERHGATLDANSMPIDLRIWNRRYAWAGKLDCFFSPISWFSGKMPFLRWPQMPNLSTLGRSGGAILCHRIPTSNHTTNGRKAVK